MSCSKADLLVAVVSAAAPHGMAKMAECGIRVAPLLGIPAPVGFAAAVMLATEKRAQLGSSIGKALDGGVRSLEQAQGSLLGRGVHFMRSTPVGQGIATAGGKVLTGLSLLTLLNPVAGAVRAGTASALRAAVALIAKNVAKAGAYATAAGLATGVALKPSSGLRTYLSNALNPEGNIRELQKLDRWKTTADSLDRLKSRAHEILGEKLPAVPSPYTNVVTKFSQFADDTTSDATVAQLIRAIQVSGRPEAVRDLVSLQSAIGMTPTSAHLASVFGVATVASLVAKYLGAGPIGGALFSVAAGMGLTRRPGAIRGSSMQRI